MGQGKLYDIKSSAMLVRNPINSVINGYTVKHVIYNARTKGVFKQQADGSWIERSPDGRFTFQEVGRDEWSVYLVKSDGLKIQLDLYRQEVIVMGQGKLYDIRASFY